MAGVNSFDSLMVKGNSAAANADAMIYDCKMCIRDRYDGGKQKQCNFKDERDVDKLLEVMAKEQPQIHLLLSLIHI